MALGLPPVRASEWRGGLLAALLVLAPTPFTPRMDEVEAKAAPLRVVRGTVPRNTTLAALLEPVLPLSVIHSLVTAARPTYDLGRISVGRPFGVALSPGGLLAAFTYGIDELRMLRVVRRGTGLDSEIVTRTHQVRTATVTGVIESSLFAAIAEAGEDDQLALDLADIFAWDVDFNTDIQRGDRFRVAVEKLFLEERFSRYGSILAAELVRGNRQLRAVRFEGSHGAGYFDPDGIPLRKAFLRSPLRFTRISSRFTGARLHPILKRVTAHFGIDYAAPIGTPVLAAADGIVVLAGWVEGFGLTVRLRHANGFETLYGHLSRIGVLAGQRVTQGSELGAVGSTGLSTGPHLDYRMTRNGGYVNPLAVVSPPTAPLPPEERGAFVAVRDSRLARLGAAIPDRSHMVRDAQP